MNTIEINDETTITSPEPTIAQLVTQDFRKAEVFKKHGIDFCCGGKKTVAKACKEKGLDAELIQKELKEAENQAATIGEDFNTMELDVLADYIVKKHHSYVIQSIPVIFQYTQKVAKVHGDRHPEAIEIASKFLIVVDELNRHMMKEENILFPFIKKLAEGKRNNSRVDAPPFGTIANPVRMMEMEHEDVGNVMEEINKLTKGFNPPADACTTFRVSYAKLKEFEDDLHQHIHLENNMLFPKAIALENELV